MKRIMFITLLTAMVGGLGAAAIAGKGEGHHDGRFGEMMIRALDSNGDGSIDRSEFEATAKAAFAQADSDGDGVLNFDEMQAFHDIRKRMWAERRFRMLDSDGDGKISTVELAAVGDRHWSRMDRDGDGMLRSDELRHRHGRHHRSGHD